jgi:hypothetical protein
VHVRRYEEALPFVQEMSKNEELKGKIWCDGKTVNYGMYSCVAAEKRMDKESPLTIMKSTKNEVRVRVRVRVRVIGLRLELELELG